MAWARAYARANRLEMVDAVAALMAELFEVEMDVDSTIHCDHNHVRRERHGGASVGQRLATFSELIFARVILSDLTGALSALIEFTLS